MEIVKNISNLGVMAAGLSDAKTRARPEESVVPEVPAIDSQAAVKLKDLMTEIKEAVEIANETLIAKNKSVRFTIDETLDRAIVTVVDKKTGEVVRQLPSEEMLNVARNIEELKGLLVKEWV